MFTPDDIQWVRNVKRNKGAELAYFDKVNGDDFELHWSSRYTTDKEALKPQIGDLILIFQAPNFYNGVQLTHLVTPIDNHVRIRKDSDHKWGRMVRTIAIAPDGKNPKPNELNFQPVNQSHSYEIQNIGYSGSEPEIQKIIWQSFDGMFLDGIDIMQESIIDRNVSEPDLNALEGTERLITKKHIIRERNSNLVTDKKNQALRKGNLKCECCDFDFEITYGDLGNGFIECHHKIPIHLGERINSIDDLALVCSNCHRMLHRKNSENEYYTIEKLRELIK